MTTIPFGALFFAWCILMAVAPIRRPRRLALVSWISSAVPNELPFLFLFIVVATGVPSVVDLDTAGGVLAFALALTSSIGLVIVARRAMRTRPAVDEALADALGARWQTERRRLPWARILLLPWPFRPRDVERVANVAYDNAGTDNLLDVYRHRSRPTGAPTLIYFHGGYFRWGRKNREARPLIHRLARQGWTCISANYHLSPTPADGFPDHLVDVKKVIAWVRTHGHEYGADPDTIVMAGSSAGAHLTAMAALTANDPTYQPGFEAVDTSITAGVVLYGYYGQLSDDPATTPLSHVRPDTPPFFVLHGDQDTFTPVEGARALVDALRATSENPVVYAELPGAQHSFDLFHSVRFETAIDGVEAFGAWLLTRDRDGGPVRPSSRT